MACAGYWSVRLAWADGLAHSDSAEQVQAALRLAPDNAIYWLHWTDLEQAHGESGGLGIVRATQADPYNAEVWIRAGLQAEVTGDFVHAEQLFLRAARQSLQYEPRWTLANYYFRRSDPEHFWPWAKSALAWSYGDRELLFDLCWRMQPDADVILERAIPDRPAVLRDYLAFLLHHDRSDAAQAVVRKLEAQASEEDRPLLLDFANRMLNQQRWPAALSAWNALCLRKVVHYTPLDPSRGPLLTNGEFTEEPLDSGFDWRLDDIKGVAAVYNESPHGLRFDFSGDQPENCNVVYQFVPVSPGKRYALRFGYRTEGIEPESGLHWRVMEATTGREILTPPLDLSSDSWTSGGLAFAVPQNVPATVVMLTYRRQPGTVRIEGTVWLRNVGLELLP